MCLVRSLGGHRPSGFLPLHLHLQKIVRGEGPGQHALLAAALPTANRHHPLESSSCSIQRTMVTLFCSKGRAGPDPGAISKFPGAPPPPHNDNTPHPQGKAGPDRVPTSRLQDAHSLPPLHKSHDSTDKAGLENGPTSKRPGFLPSPPQNKSSHPKGKAGLVISIT